MFGHHMCNYIRHTKAGYMTAAEYSSAGDWYYYPLHGNENDVVCLLLFSVLCIIYGAQTEASRSLEGFMLICIMWLLWTVSLTDPTILLV